MTTQHVGNAQQERESRDSANKRNLELIAFLAATSMIVACAIAMFLH